VPSTKPAHKLEELLGVELELCATDELLSTELDENEPPELEPPEDDELPELLLDATEELLNAAARDAEQGRDFSIS